MKPRPFVFLQPLAMTQLVLDQRLSAFVCALSLGLLSTSLVACGGTQRGNGLSEFQQDIALQNILEIVPAGVSFAYFVDILEEDVDEGRVRWGNSPLAPMFARAVEEQTGHNLTDPEGLAEIGVDVRGEFGVYSTTALPVGIARLAEPTKFDDFVSNYRARNPDMVWSAFTIGGSEFWSTSINEGNEVALAVDVGVVGNYALVRLRSNVEGSFVTDEALATLISGSTSPSLADDPRILGLQVRADGPITSVGLLDTDLYRKTIGFWAAALRDSSNIDSLPSSTADVAACDAVSDAIAAAMPWHAGIQFRNGTARHGVHVTQLSDVAAERARAIVGGTSAEALDAARESPLFVAVNINLDAALALMNGDPLLANECADLGMLSGLLGSMQRQLTPQAREGISKLTGRMMFSLEGFTVTGFIPRLTAGLTIGSFNPVPITESVQSMLNEAGATGRVDDTAPYTTFEYSLLGYDIRISQLLDRVVVSTAGVPIALVNAMAVSEEQSGQFVELRLQGPPIAAMLREAERYILGSYGNESWSVAESMASASEAIGRMSYSLGLDGNTLVGTLETEFVPLNAE